MSKLDQDVTSAMSDLIVEAIAKDGVRSPAEILRRVQNKWTLEKPVPSHMTLRKNIADALQKLTNVSGGLIIVNSRIPQDVLETAKGFGEFIAIDHIGLHVFVASEGGPVAPIATAADTFSLAVGARFPNCRTFECHYTNSVGRAWLNGCPDCAHTKACMHFPEKAELIASGRMSMRRHFVMLAPLSKRDIQSEHYHCLSASLGLV